MNAIAKIEIRPIGVVHSCYREKFGIPRQPGLVKSSKGRIELLEEFAREEMVKGLAGFSHIWVHFIFHAAVKDGWRPTVRPPWLGGQERVGVFATRSPHRPNHLGMSVVRLEGIVWEKKKLFLEISGLDLLDQTPVVDIKPYIAYSDIIDDADSAYATLDTERVTVEFSEESLIYCAQYEAETGRGLAMLISETLSQDPRPASQRQKIKEFGMTLWDLNVRWQVRDGVFYVYSICRDDD